MRLETKRQRTLDAVSLGMSPPDIDTAQLFLQALGVALSTGDFAPVAALLTSDVECVTPQRSGYGLEAVTEELSRARPPETLALEFERGDWKTLGNGRYACEVRALFRSKSTGEVSYSRDRSFVLTVSAGKISRCEMRFAE